MCFPLSKNLEAEGPIEESKVIVASDHIDTVSRVAVRRTTSDCEVVEDVPVTAREAIPRKESRKIGAIWVRVRPRYKIETRRDSGQCVVVLPLSA